MNNKANIVAQQNAVSAQKAQNITNAISGVANTAADIASSEDLYKKS